MIFICYKIRRQNIPIFNCNITYSCNPRNHLTFIKQDKKYINIRLGTKNLCLFICFDRFIPNLSVITINLYNSVYENTNEICNATS